jgi:hypothetical protein
MKQTFKEEWKEFVPPFKTKKRYFVSNYGNLKAKRIGKDGAVVERELKGSLIDGYRYIGFAQKETSKKGEKSNYHFSFHYLVGLLFLDHDPKKHTHVIHLDYDRKNNVVTNLQWATREEMLAHAKKSPYVIQAKKNLVEFNKMRDGHKLTVKDVIRLKKMLFDPNRKTKYKVIAKQFGISEMQLYRIKSGQNWGHIKVELDDIKK